MFLGEKVSDWKSTANLVRMIAKGYRLPYFTISPTYSVCPEHGYIAGEVWECPICHKKTEVYSRITGYYRPVQNWNDGKAQEFKDRKTYAVETDHPHSVPGDRTAEKPVLTDTGRKPVQLYSKPRLFTTKKCPNCKIIKPQLDAAQVAYELVDAEENAWSERRGGGFLSDASARLYLRFGLRMALRIALWSFRTVILQPFDRYAAGELSSPDDGRTCRLWACFRTSDVADTYQKPVCRPVHQPCRGNVLRARHRRHHSCLDLRAWIFTTITVSPTFASRNVLIYAPSHQNLCGQFLVDGHPRVLHFHDQVARIL